MTTTETTKFSPTVEELTAKLVKFSGGGQINDFEEDRGTWKLREPIPCEGPLFLFIRVLDVSDAELAHGHKWGAEVVAVSPFLATDASICDFVDCGKVAIKAWIVVEHSISIADGPFN